MHVYVSGAEWLFGSDIKDKSSRSSAFSSLPQSSQMSTPSSRYLSPS